MSLTEIVELVFRIIAMILVSASVICIVAYGAEAISDGMRLKKKK